MTVAECAKLLGSKDGILLLTHKNPDGDTVMSAAALCRALRRKNKKACLYPNPQITAKQLPFAEKLFAPEGYEPEHVIAVDLAAENLFPEGFSGPVDLCIDHHPSNPHYALKGDLVLPESSPACGISVGALNVRAKTGAVIVEVVRRGARLRNIGADFTFAVGDVLTAIADGRQRAELKSLLGVVSE